MSGETRLLLAGDIGGTKTALAIFAAGQDLGRSLAQATFSSTDYVSLEAIVRAFLTEKGVQIARASFGVAGPVIEDRVQVTNLPWVVDARSLSLALGAPVVLVNDLDAIAHVIQMLGPSDVETLNEGQPEEHGDLAVIAPGTGLGEALVLWNGTRYEPHPSEGGHANFAPTTKTEIELLDYLLPRLDHVSFERVCSGLGLPNLYAFLRDTGRASEPEWLGKQMASAQDPTPIIVQAAMENRAEICTATLDLFVSILGSEAGNLALKVLATGGVYIGGGIPPRILPRLKGKALMQAFTHKGRFSDLLARIPVHVILNPQAALLGAACHGFDAVI